MSRRVADGRSGSRLDDGGSPVRILYDFLQVRGGAERVSMTLANELPARLLVHAVAPAYGPVPHHVVDTLSQSPLAANPMLRAVAAWRAFSGIGPQSGIDAVLFSGHYAPLAWRAFNSAQRILYLHGPPLPFAYDRDDPSLARLPSAFRGLLRWPLARLAASWVEAARAMHLVFANSAFVATEFQRVVGRAATVLSPPVDERFFACARPSEGYWISLARHEPMKRLTRIVDAFLGLPAHSLVIAGGGSETTSLRRRALGAPNIRFVGTLDTDALAYWLGGARASIHISRAEPFGLAIAESLAAGVPVLTCAEGGAAELITHADAGQVLTGDPDVGSLREAIVGFSAARDGAAVERLSSSMRRLRPARFVAALREALGKSIESHCSRRIGDGRSSDA